MVRYAHMEGKMDGKWKNDKNVQRLLVAEKKKVTNDKGDECLDWWLRFQSKRSDRAEKLSFENR